MKHWISPPAQLVLWLGGVACLLAAAWSLWQLRQASVDDHMGRNQIQIAVPDAKALNVPGIGSYRSLVQAPLFWEMRAVPRPIVAQQPVAVRPPPPIVEEVPLNPPAGRLVGIVDLGNKRYALIRNQTGNQSLYKGDTWEGWKVDRIEAGQVVLTAGTQYAEIPLIGDFAAPQPNKQLLAAKQRRQQRQREKHLRIQRQRQQKLLQQQAQQSRTGAVQPALDDADSLDYQQAQAAREKLEQALNSGGGAEETAQGQPSAPVMSIKEALEARQRLMASRWGNKDEE